jgi:hypothetical protein
MTLTAPGYDPNNLDRAGRFGALNRDPGSPVFNRATQSSYPPGSTFKVVTDIAAIDSGRYTPDSTVSGQNGKVISGVPLQNDNGESFGPIPLTQALTFSVNTVWAEVAETLGKSTMGRYMTRLGFYSKPPLDYPADQRIASGEYRNGQLLSPLSPSIDVGRMGIGQDLLAVTPLQMAMVASAVANNGLEGRRSRGPRARRHPPAGGVARHAPVHGQDGGQHDVPGRQGGHGHGRGALGHRGGGQDRDGREEPVLRQPDVVHRLRPGQQPQDRGRGHERVRHRHRGRGRRADRQAGHGGVDPLMVAN